MTDNQDAPVRLWLEISHHPVFAVGGWAYVRAEAGGVTGLAGGDKRLTAERAALLGLVAALKTLAPGAAAELRTSSPDIFAVPARLRAAAAGEDPPAENLDLWAAIMTALAPATVRILRAAPAPATPTAFAAGWAELGRDKAKATGAFSAPIPRTNLAKAGA